MLLGVSSRLRLTTLMVTGIDYGVLIPQIRNPFTRRRDRVATLDRSVIIVLEGNTSACTVADTMADGLAILVLLGCVRLDVSAVFYCDVTASAFVTATNTGRILVFITVRAFGIDPRSSSCYGHVASARLVAATDAGSLVAAVG
jgi:hypothetical protein